MFLNWPFPSKSPQTISSQEKRQLITCKLKEIRFQRKLVQKQIAKDLHISREFISMIENETKLPSLYTALRLSQYLEVTVEDLFVLGRQPKPISEAEAFDKQVQADLKKLYPDIDWDVPRSYP